MAMDGSFPSIGMTRKTRLRSLAGEAGPGMFTGGGAGGMLGGTPARGGNGDGGGSAHGSGGGGGKTVHSGFASSSGGGYGGGVGSPYDKPAGTPGRGLIVISYVSRGGVASVPIY